ncbi:hypothetical protein AU375_00259 [Methylobacterium radiotolerans]|nr:hypothetical protein AU375_00259 [Methylobacterium radiotolerans]
MPRVRMTGRGGRPSATMPCASRVTIRRVVSPTLMVSGSGLQESVIATSLAGSHQGSLASGPPVGSVHDATGKGIGFERTSTTRRSPTSLTVSLWTNGSMVNWPAWCGKTATVRSNAMALWPSASLVRLQWSRPSCVQEKLAREGCTTSSSRIGCL